MMSDLNKFITFVIYYKIIITQIDDIHRIKVVFVEKNRRKNG